MEKKPLFDKTIEFDIEHLPKELKEMIHKLEKFDEEGDWFNYDLTFDELEMRAKVLMIANVISKYDYEKILNKYGWLYD